MQVVAAVAHLQDIRNRALRTRRLALGQQVRLFMLIAEEARRRGIGLAEHQMTDGPEPRRAPGLQELVRLRPAVEAHAKAIRTQDPKGLEKGRPEPPVVAVVLD